MPFRRRYARKTFTVVSDNRDEEKRLIDIVKTRAGCLIRHPHKGAGVDYIVLDIPREITTVDVSYDEPKRAFSPASVLRAYGYFWKDGRRIAPERYMPIVVPKDWLEDQAESVATIEPRYIEGPMVDRPSTYFQDLQNQDRCRLKFAPLPSVPPHSGKFAALRQAMKAASRAKRPRRASTPRTAK